MQTGIASLSGGVRKKGNLDSNARSQPLVSVITAVFNGAPSLPRCLQSVLQQDYSNIEHIVIDGGSSDGTLDLLRLYDNRIAFWKSEPDRGIYDAWNKGLLEARGEWVCFLGADDEFLPGAVSAYIRFAAQHPDAEYLCAQVNLTHPSGYVRTIGAPWTWKAFSKRMCTAHVGSMHRRRLFQRLGNFDISYRIAADYEFLLRAGTSLRTAYLPAITARMSTGGMSSTYKAIAEEARAKISAGGRNKLLAAAEMFVAQLKYPHRPLRAVVAKFLTQSSSHAHS